ncbi:MAG: sortase [Candidatus Peribacteraceae bacterium]|nr:sortase [Candidatus Peribacteraceae bacterium]
MALAPDHDQASYTPDGHIVIGGGSHAPSSIPVEPEPVVWEEVQALMEEFPDPEPEPIPIPPKPRGPTAAQRLQANLSPVIAAVQSDFAAMGADLHESTIVLVERSVADMSAAGAKLSQSAKAALVEGSRQLSATTQDGQRVGSALYDESTTLAGRFWYFLKQPVRIPRKGKAARTQSRGLLFVGDVARFGMTFAAIFGALFVGLNYESFWQIASAELDPLAGIAQLQPAGQSLQAKLEGLDEARGDLNDLVPTVGPPTNLLIVPKLNLNVPIVNPPADSLLREDWAGLENDIQTALQDGVVHYPGTANPGQAGNFFVTGHSSYYAWGEGDYKSVFARLHELEVGDEYWVYYGGDKHRFSIVSKAEVQPSDVHVLDQPGNQRTATLMTCTPVGTTLRRLVVSAVEVDPVTAEPLAVGEHGTQEALPRVQVEVLPI